MRLEQHRWTRSEGWEPKLPQAGADAHLLLAFGSTELLRERARLDELSRCYPQAHVLSCSTAGEIQGTQVTDDSLVVTAVWLERSWIAGASTRIADATESFRAGRELALRLPAEDLVHVLVLSDGLNINGSDLVRGLAEELPPSVAVTGGLSADGARFAQTVVGWDAAPGTDVVAAVGLYGPSLRVGFGSLGGWDPFGPERIITRSRGNVLHELDGQSALELYKRYLGEHASGLPATGLLFPLSVRTHDGESGVVRTILSVDEREQTLTFAGDMPEGAHARLMKANFDRLIDGAAGAARTSMAALGGWTPELALLISCVGRKLVLQQRIEEEIEGMREVVGPSVMLTGFYSYGEISPFTPQARCALHNQTMTVTLLAEA